MEGVNVQGVASTYKSVVDSTYGGGDGDGSMYMRVGGST